MAVWNAQYKNNPQDDNNPGFGAESIRDLKGNIEGIVGNEHNFDTSDVASQGKHLPGSAIVDLDSDASAVDNGQKGRITATTLDTTYATLGVNGDSQVQNVKGYNQVSVDGDETVGGIKTFTTAPVITGEVSDASPDGTLANVGYVKTKTTTSNIEPVVNNVGPALSTDVNSYNGDTLYTFNTNLDTSDLEGLLAQIKSELDEVRQAIVAAGLMNPYGQDLRTTSSPTFNGLTVSTNIVATGNITGANIYGAVWG